MTQLRELYRCSVCGNLVEVAFNSVGTLVCCDKPMVKLEAKTEDEGREKHVPVVEETDKGVKVKVGSVAHPMEDKHYITFIEVLTRDKVIRTELKPGGAPEAVFCVNRSDITGVREFCNVHMLWKNK